MMKAADSNHRSAMASVGGAATLGSGAAFVVLQLALFGAIALGVARQNEAAGLASGSLRMATHVRHLLQGINETVVTDGAQASKATVIEAIKRFDADRQEVKIEGALAAAKLDWRNYSERARSLLSMRDYSNDNVEGMIEVGKLTREGARLASELDRFATLSNEAHAKSRTLLLWLIGTAIAVSMLGTAAIYFMFFRRVTQPLRRAERFAEQIAGGDLSMHIDTAHAGEAAGLVRALRRMQENLSALVGDVRDGTLMVSTAAGQVTAASLDLSSRTETQASTLEETASSMQQLTATVKQTAANTVKASDAAGRASAVARASGEVAADASATMWAIRQSSSRIGEIVSLIDSIAFQTNILALNAAVEAARAGEQGRGFAVVAGEVRALAQRSAASAKEIKVLIEDTSGQIAQGTELVERSGEAMEKIVASIVEVDHNLADIAAAAREQAAGIDQVNRAVLQLEEVTQHNAGMVEQAGATANSMNQQAANLRQLIGKFRLDTPMEGDPAKNPAGHMRHSRIGVESRSRPGYALPQRARVRG